MMDAMTPDPDQDLTDACDAMNRAAMWRELSRPIGGLFINDGPFTVFPENDIFTATGDDVQPGA